MTDLLTQTIIKDVIHPNSTVSIAGEGVVKSTAAFSPDYANHWRQLTEGPDALDLFDPENIAQILFPRISKIDAINDVKVASAIRLLHSPLESWTDTLGRDLIYEGLLLRYLAIINGQFLSGAGSHSANPIAFLPVAEVRQIGVDWQLALTIGLNETDRGSARVSPYYSSERLAGHLDAEEIAPRLAMTLLDQASVYLDWLHKNDICHGDVKRANLMYRFNPETGVFEPVWIDFGSVQIKGFSRTGAITPTHAAFEDLVNGAKKTFNPAGERTSHAINILETIAGKTDIFAIPRDITSVIQHGHFAFREDLTGIIESRLEITHNEAQLIKDYIGISLHKDPQLRLRTNQMLSGLIDIFLNAAGDSDAVVLAKELMQFAIDVRKPSHLSANAMTSPESQIKVKLANADPKTVSKLAARLGFINIIEALKPELSVPTGVYPVVPEDVLLSRIRAYVPLDGNSTHILFTQTIKFPDLAISGAGVTADTTTVVVQAD